MSEYLNRTLAVLMAIAMLASCSLPTSGPGRPGEAALLSAAAKAMSVDGVIEEVGKALSSEYGDDPAWQDTLAELSSSSAYGVAEKALGEGSQEYLEFCIAASEAESVDSILKAASGLAPESELDKVRDAVSDLEAEAKLMFASDTKILTPEQEEDFYDDLTNLVITSAVLLTAAIVYWAVPDVILWGKITAAAAVAIVAGVAAGMIMAIVEHYDTGKDAGETFMDWLETVATKVSADWAVAAAVISLGTTVGREPVVTAIVLGLFWLFGVADEAEEIIGRYELLGSDGEDEEEEEEE